MQFSIIYLMGIMYVGSAKHMNNMNKVFIRIYLWVSLLYICKGAMISLYDVHGRRPTDVFTKKSNLSDKKFEFYKYPGYKGISLALIWHCKENLNKVYDDTSNAITEVHKAFFCERNPTHESEIE